MQPVAAVRVLTVGLWGWGRQEFGIKQGLFPQPQLLSPAQLSAVLFLLLSMGITWEGAPMAPVHLWSRGQKPCVPTRALLKT